MKKGQLGKIEIPACISDRQDISDAAQKLYGVINKLIDWMQFKYGLDYCYPSNYWLCKKFAKRREGKEQAALPLRTLSSWLKSLEEKGYIRRETAVYNGKTQRHIYLSEEYKTSLPPEIEDDFEVEFEIAEEDLTEESDSKDLWQETATPQEGNIFLPDYRQKTAEGMAENCHHNYKKQSSNLNLKNSLSQLNPPYPPFESDSDKVGLENGGSFPPPYNLPAAEDVSFPKKEGTRRRREKLKTPEELSAEGYLPRGRFQNIWLTPAEKIQLNTDFGAYGDYYVDDIIEQLSAYVAHVPGYCLNVYYAAVRDWCLRKRPKRDKSSNTQNDDDFFSTDELLLWQEVMNEQSG